MLSQTLTGLAAQTLAVPPRAIFFTWVPTWFLGALKSNLLCLAQAPNLSIAHLLTHACAETTWLSYLLYEPLVFPTLLHCDNLSATYMAANLVFHARTRHIELDYHFVCERVALRSHCVVFVPSIDQPADLLTKALHAQTTSSASSVQTCLPTTA